MNGIDFAIVSRDPDGDLHYWFRPAPPDYPWGEPAIMLYILHRYEKLFRDQIDHDLLGVWRKTDTGWALIMVGSLCRSNLKTNA